MKKVLFIASVILALASCNQEDGVDQSAKNAVSFGTYTSSVKAGYQGDINTAVLQKPNVGFGVFAYYTGTSKYADVKPAPNFMYNQLVTYNDSKLLWLYSPVKYWPSVSGPSSDRLTFFAYAPYVSNPTLAKADSVKTGIVAMSRNTVSGDPYLDFVVATKASEQIDLLYANQARNNTTDLTKDENGHISGTSDNKVKFVFCHALSKLAIYAQAVVDADVAPTTALDANTKITLSKVIFKGPFYNSGRLNVAQGSWSNQKGATETTISAEGVSINVTESRTYLAGTDIMVIPFDNRQSYTVEVAYTVTTVDPNLAGKQIVSSTDVVKTADLSFTAGKRNTLTLLIGLTSVKLDATVEDWSTEGSDNQNIDLPQNFLDN